MNLFRAQFITGFGVNGAEIAKCTFAACGISDDSKNTDGQSGNIVTAGFATCVNPGPHKN